MVAQSIPRPVPVLAQAFSNSTKDTSSTAGNSPQPDPVYSTRRIPLMSLPCELKPDFSLGVPNILPCGGRYINSVRVIIRLPGSRRVIPGDQCIFWMFAMSPLLSNSKCTAGPTVRGRIPARAASPFEDGYELSDRYCGYKARGSFAPITLELALPGEYTVTAWVGSNSTTYSQSYHVTPFFP